MLIQNQLFSLSNLPLQSDATGQSVTDKKLPEGWREICFGELLIGGTRNGVYVTKEFHGRGVKIVNMGELFAYPRLVNVPMKRVELSPEELERSYLIKGDLLFARRSLVSEGAGKCSMVCEIAEPTTFESSIIRARPDPDITDSFFLFYLFSSTYGQYLMKTIRRDMAVAGITGTDLAALKIPLPPLPTQRRIAAILGCLDDKIDLLRKENKTLEAIAQTLFKRWFVEFNFPDAIGKPYKEGGGKMVESELGEVPEGWRVGRLIEFGKVICGKTPSKSNPEYFGGRVPFIKIPDMHNQMFITETQDSLTEVGADSQKQKFIPPNSILVSCIATVGLVSISSQSSQTNQQINTIVPNSKHLLGYLYFILRNMKSDLQAMGSGGSATLNINSTSFANIEINFPPANILAEFQVIIDPIMSKILLNLFQIQYYSRFRDTLLPKLISGEILVT